MLVPLGDIIRRVKRKEVKNASGNKMLQKALDEWTRMLPADLQKAVGKSAAVLFKNDALTVSVGSAAPLGELMFYRESLKKALDGVGRKELRITFVRSDS